MQEGVRELVREGVGLGEGGTTTPVVASTVSTTPEGLVLLPVLNTTSLNTLSPHTKPAVREKGTVAAVAPDEVVAILTPLRKILQASSQAQRPEMEALPKLVTPKVVLYTWYTLPSCHLPSQLPVAS